MFLSYFEKTHRGEETTPPPFPSIVIGLRSVPLAFKKFPF